MKELKNIQAYTEFVNEAKSKLPSLLTVRHLFNGGITDIMKAIKKLSKYNIDAALYEKIRKSATTNGSWSSKDTDQETFIYVFLESWKNLSKLKMSHDDAVDIIAEVDRDAKFIYYGGKKSRLELDRQLDETLMLCKKDYERVFALTIWAKKNSMNYPSAFRRVMESRYSTVIANDIRIQSFVEYTLSIEALDKKLLGL